MALKAFEKLLSISFKGLYNDLINLFATLALYPVALGWVEGYGSLAEHTSFGGRGRLYFGMFGSVLIGISVGKH